MSASAIELPGLAVVVDNVIHHYDPEHTPVGSPHIFIYFLTIRNRSNYTVTLLARKWVIVRADGDKLVIEGDKIVGETPVLKPGQDFSYNSFHVTGISSRAEGSFHGLDHLGRHVAVRIPAFAMDLPEPDARDPVE